MNAVISGRAGLALLIEGESLMSLDVDDLETLVPRSRYDLRFLLADATDLVTLENTDRDQIAERLNLEHNIACALDMTLIGLDASASMELRMEGIETLDELFADERVIERLEFTMYAKPLPESVDLIGALFCAEGTTVVTRSFFERLSQYQTAIDAVREAWDALPDLLFGNDQTAKGIFHNIVCHEGLFRLLALSYGSQTKVMAFGFDALKSKSINSLPNHREIIERWRGPIHEAVASVHTAFAHPRDDDYDEVTNALQDSGSRNKQEEWRVGLWQGIERQRNPTVAAGTSNWISATSGQEAGDLVKLISRGYSSAEEKLVRMYSKGVTAIVKDIVKSPPDTEDVSQEAFKKVLEKLRRGELREPERLSGFVCSVARNSAIDYIRRAKRSYSREEIGHADHIFDPAPNQLQQVLKQERAGVVRQVINELKIERDREVLFRYYIAEEDKDRICADLGLPRTQFNNVISRAMARFKDLYIKRVEVP